ncbi:hypothetical protein G7048_15765 [Diaphorobacter sp. HDW4B]|uniref:hypothetical protein n=1 Tax=Diaphorobacter sp. HDW4B TaxID=2714925 RepID=UPI00140CF384|nr:hypothetical protein [Diaphorobacter sp. HDW4B]QIL71684.1 hypothetical protein G7048_15765 [Diaphorobacter sp. HDW4B]
MTRFVLLALLFATAVMAGVIYVSEGSEKAVIFYGNNVRASLFTGLLTVGSFLLSMKVFIVVKFKETVFDTEWYKKRLEDRRKIDPQIEHYAPVRNLSRVLFMAIASAIVGSLSQVTIGLIPHVAALTFCVVTASFAGAMLVQTLLLVRRILTEWLDHTEKKPAA